VCQRHYCKSIIRTKYNKCVRDTTVSLWLELTQQVCQRHCCKSMIRTKYNKCVKDTAVSLWLELNTTSVSETLL
jgi:hypothetical protein